MFKDGHGHLTSSYDASINVLTVFQSSEPPLSVTKTKVMLLRYALPYNLTLDITVTKVMLLDSILSHSVSSGDKYDKRSLNIAIFLILFINLSYLFPCHKSGPNCPPGHIMPQR